jgi:hypothetical protein
MRRKLSPTAYPHPPVGHFSSLFRPTISGRKIMPTPRSKPYGLLKFLADLIMTGVTGGLWLVWVIVREIRYR